MYKLLQIISIWANVASTVGGKKMWFDYNDPRVVCRGSSGWDHKHCENIPQFVCQGLSDENRKVFTWLCEPHTSINFVWYKSRVLTVGLYMYDMDDKLEEVINPTYTLRVEKKTHTTRVFHLLLSLSSVFRMDLLFIRGRFASAHNPYQMKSKRSY